jgi:hypothetical protein
MAAWATLAPANSTAARAKDADFFKVETPGAVTA